MQLAFQTSTLDDLSRWAEREAHTISLKLVAMRRASGRSFHKAGGLRKSLFFPILVPALTRESAPTAEKHEARPSRRRRSFQGPRQGSRPASPSESGPQVLQPQLLLSPPLATQPLRGASTQRGLHRPSPRPKKSHRQAEVVGGEANPKASPPWEKPLAPKVLPSG